MPVNVERKLAAIMFTDIVGSTALMAKSEPVALVGNYGHLTYTPTEWQPITFDRSVHINCEPLDADTY